MSLPSICHDMLFWLKYTYRENSAPDRYVAGKEVILIVILDNCGYSALIKNRNVSSDSFLENGLDDMGWEGEAGAKWE